MDYLVSMIKGAKEIVRLPTRKYLCLDWKYPFVSTCELVERMNFGSDSDYYYEIRNPSTIYSFCAYQSEYIVERNKNNPILRPEAFIYELIKQIDPGIKRYPYPICIPIGRIATPVSLEITRIDLDYYLYQNRGIE